LKSFNWKQLYTHHHIFDGSEPVVASAHYRSMPTLLAIQWSQIWHVWDTKKLFEYQLKSTHSLNLRHGA